jgi:ParB family chromosome partitioning protein
MSAISQYSSELIVSVEDVSMSAIRCPKYVLRTIVQELGELADSIRRIGLLQPIMVRMKETYFEIVAGNRRYMACRSLGWRKIACHVVELDDKTAFEVSIVENVQRRTLSVLEEGMAFKKYVTDFGWGGVSELAQKISKSPTYVSRRIKLLELPPAILDLIANTSINVATAEELVYINNESKQSELAALISCRHLSSRKVRDIIKENETEHRNTFLEYTSTDRIQETICKSFDKSIIALRISMRTLSTVIENIEDYWIFYDIFMEHRNMLSAQIDLLIKEKKRFKKKSKHIARYWHD